jgi:hypothetical protein
MVTLETLLALLSARKNRVLRFAQAALPDSQFQAFRRLFLDEFGKSGLERELARVFVEDGNKDRHGQGRNT